jgi:hypothetical protein
MKVFIHIVNSIHFFRYLMNQINLILVQFYHNNNRNGLSKNFRKDKC